MPVLDALLLIGGKSKGKLWALRQWELETVLALGWTESRWVRLGLTERYRKVCAHKLGDWLQALETEEEIKRIKARGSGKH